MGVLLLMLLLAGFLRPADYVGKKNQLVQSSNYVRLMEKDSSSSLVCKKYSSKS